MAISLKYNFATVFQHKQFNRAARRSLREVRGKLLLSMLLSAFYTFRTFYIIDASCIVSVAYAAGLIPGFLVSLALSVLFMLSVRFIIAVIFLLPVLLITSTVVSLSLLFTH